MLRAGADKISINSSALAEPDLIRAGAEKFGSQCIVVSIDAKKVASDQWQVFSHGGRKSTGFDAVEWAKRAVSLGAGEIVLNSIDADGTKAGFDLEITRRVSESVGVVPVVASGGAGKLEHMASVLLEGKADAVLAASIFILANTQWETLRNISRIKEFQSGKCSSIVTAGVNCPTVRWQNPNGILHSLLAQCCSYLKPSAYSNPNGHQQVGVRQFSSEPAPAA